MITQSLFTYSPAAKYTPHESHLSLLTYKRQHTYQLQAHPFPKFSQNPTKPDALVLPPQSYPAQMSFLPIFSALALSTLAGLVYWGYRELRVLQEESKYHKMRKAKVCPDLDTVYRFQEVVRAIA